MSVLGLLTKAGEQKEEQLKAFLGEALAKMQEWERSGVSYV